MSGLGVAGLTKRFGAKTVLSDVDFHVAPGEIVALIGENGAGKTTLLRVVSGFLQPDAGSVQVDGSAVRLRGPRDAAARGVGMVHQHFLLIPELTVAENVVLGREPGTGPLLDLDAAADEVRDCGKRFGLDVDPEARVGDLGVSAQQRVELLKVLVRGARFLLLDEPTGLLPPQGVKELFTLMERLASEGCGVVLVTHRLREVFAVCSRASVLRHGAVTGERNTAASDERELARLMIGEDLDLDTRTERVRDPAARTLLFVDGLTVHGRGARSAVADASFVVRAGEMVGIAGVAGSGQVALLEALAGIRPVAGGTATLAGSSLLGLPVRRRRLAGLGYVPEDRVHDGLVGDMTVAENLVLGTAAARGFFRGGWIVREKVIDEGREVVTTHDVRPPDPDALCNALSGGNQQKVLMARELRRNPRVLLAAEPVRGLDFRATEAVHRRLRSVCDEGGAVVVVSTDLGELLDTCDRILVMFGGRIAGEVRPKETTEDEIGLLMAGAHR